MEKRGRNMEYFKSAVTRDWLYNNGFKFDKYRSDYEMSVYSKRIPVYKYNLTIILEAEIAIEETGKTTVDVYDNGTHNPYPPFYNIEYGREDKVLETVTKKIETELRRLKITRKKEINKRGKNS